MLLENEPAADDLVHTRRLCPLVAPPFSAQGPISTPVITCKASRLSIVFLGREGLNGECPVRDLMTELLIVETVYLGF